MREIKFRGKRIDNGEWIVGFLELHLVDGDLTKTKQDAFITCDYMDKMGKVYRDRFEIIPETVGQFTGIKDRNGVDIYENDILKYSWDDVETIDAITYQRPLFTYRNSMRWSINEDEVIGNIHDNPELMEVI